MSNENDENKKKNEDLNNFLAEGAEERSKESALLRNSVRELEKRIEKIEKNIDFLNESRKNTSDFIFTLNEYMDASKGEIIFYKRVRILMVGISLLLVAFLLALLVCVIFFHQFFFYMQGPYFRSALVLATIGGSVVVTSLVLRGVFRLAAERHTKEHLPPHIRDLASAANAINQSQGG